MVPAPGVQLRIWLSATPSPPRPHLSDLCALHPPSRARPLCFLPSASLPSPVSPFLCLPTSCLWHRSLSRPLPLLYCDARPDYAAAQVHRAALLPGKSPAAEGYKVPPIFPADAWNSSTSANSLISRTESTLRGRLASPLPPTLQPRK